MTVVDRDFYMFDLVEIFMKTVFVLFKMIGLWLTLKRPVGFYKNKSVYDIVKFGES